MIFAEKLSSTFSTLKLLAFILTVPSFLTACSSTSKNITVKPSSKELYLVSHPPKETLAKIEALMPVAMKWYDKVDKALYKSGRELTTIEKKQAKQ